MEGDHSKLDEWANEGLVSFEQADAIRVHEGEPPPEVEGRLIEASSYVGAVLLLLGSFIIASELLDDGNEGGALAALVVAMVLLAAAGAYVLRSAEPPSTRGVGFVLGLTAIAALGAANVLFVEIADAGDSTVLLVGLVTLLVGFAGWRTRPSAPTQIVFYLGGVLTIVGFMILVELSDIDVFFFDFESFGRTLAILLWLLGAVWLFLGWAGIVGPVNTAYALGSATLLIASAALTSIDDPWIVLTAATAAGLLAGGIYLRRTVLAAFGTGAAALLLGLFLGLILEVEGTAVGVVFAVVGAVGLGAAAYLVFEETRYAVPPLAPPPPRPEEPPLPTE